MFILCKSRLNYTKENFSNKRKKLKYKNVLNY